MLDQGVAHCRHCKMQLSPRNLRSVAHLQGLAGRRGRAGFFCTATGVLTKELADCEFEDLAESGQDLRQFRVELEENSRDTVILEGCPDCPKVVYSFNKIKDNLP